MPLAKLFAFFTAAAVRNGCEIPGPSYVEQSLLQAKRAAKAAYAAANGGTP
jgi:hypothetical protein